MTLTDGSVVLRDFRAGDIINAATNYSLSVKADFVSYTAFQPLHSVKKYVAHMTEQAVALAALPDTSENPE